MIIANGIKVVPQSNTAATGHFFVGGTVGGEESSHFIKNQMLVEVYVPTKQKHEFPLIFFHGAGQTNLNWMETPDGRMGWKDYFLEEGYIVFLVEQPSRGRSPYHPSVNGPQIYAPIEKLKKRFTSSSGNWKESKMHNQWPGNGSCTEDPDFWQFASSQVEYLASNTESQQLILNNAAQLLNKTGPAILLTHSQAGPFGWLIADAYPDRVKGIVALEPSGPPFSNGKNDTLKPNFGITDLPLHFSPKVTNATDLEKEWFVPQKEGIKAGWMIKKHSYTLPNLQEIPILIVTGEASYHRCYDELTSEFLSRVCVPHDHVCLDEVGIHGNGHMMMMEKNNLEIAGYISNWLQQHVQVEEKERVK